MATSEPNMAIMRVARKMTIGIGAAMFAVLIGTIAVIVLCISAFVNVLEADQGWSVGLYLVGLTAILAAIAYTDGVCNDVGASIDKKKE